MSKEEFLFFYGHTPDKEYACFSNWYPSEFTKDSQKFANTEQYMMYRKAKLMGDNEMAEKILGEGDPKRVKALGRKVRNWNEELWVAHREEVMYDGCLAKFSEPSNAKLKEELLSTGCKCLVEASPYDKIWGIGMNRTHKDRFDRSKWKGMNLLGKTLNRVRETLQRDE